MAEMIATPFSIGYPAG